MKTKIQKTTKQQKNIHSKVQKKLDELEWFEGSLRARFGLENESQAKVLQIATNLMISSAIDDSTELQKKGIIKTLKMKDAMFNSLSNQSK